MVTPSQMMEDVRKVEDLEGDEVIMFAGQAWEVDSSWENRGDWHVECNGPPFRSGRLKLSFQVPKGTALDVLVPC